MARPASVLCQRGQSVWVHTNSDIKKVAACKVKPYELLKREDNKEKQVKEKIMLEDGLKDVEDLIYPEEEEKRDAKKLNDVTSNVVGANYLKIVNNMSFF